MAFAIFLSACSSNANPPSIAISTVNITAKPTFTSLPVPTQTLAPSPIPVIPTLSLDQARLEFLDLLANNGNCDLPCFWGITPGQSSFQEAIMILVPLTDISDFTHFEKGIGAIDPAYIEDGLTIHTNISFLTGSGNQTVSRLAFIARVLKKADNGFTDVFDWPFFSEQLGYYMLPNILTEYGNPTTVMLSTMAKLPSTGVPGGFKILLLYPDQGILINYTMQMQVAGENIMGCPSYSHIELDLYPSEQTTSFFNLLEPSGWLQIIQNTYKPIGEATAMSKEDFYQIFSQQTDKCILTPANLWPVPD